jgi:hypothetical protein
MAVSQVQEITFEECPQVLQDHVRKIQESIKLEIFYAQRSERTPYKDKSIVVRTYRVYAQYGYEIVIYKTTDTDGGSPLDGEVDSNHINASEIEIIATKAQWIGDDLRKILNPA